MTKNSKARVLISGIGRWMFHFNRITSSRFIDSSPLAIQGYYRVHAINPCLYTFFRSVTTENKKIMMLISRIIRWTFDFNQFYKTRGSYCNKL